jgi:RNA polymerase sigma-70 factor (ECF subfamily)
LAEFDDMSEFESATPSGVPVLTTLVEELPEDVQELEQPDPALPVTKELISEAPLSAPEESEERPGDDPDLALTTAFLGGSQEAFLQLYAKYEAPLLLYCKRMLANETVAEDAFQDLWIRVFELRDKKVVIGSFRALVFRSARNLCLNTLRREKMRAGSSDRLIGIFAPDETNLRSEHRQIKSLLRQALARVPFNEREAFVLHEYSGYSYSEIAEMMQTNEANVKVRAYRARTRLRKLIQGWLGLAVDGDPLDVI